jgi:hypothetical protein
VVCSALTVSDAGFVAVTAAHGLLWSVEQQHVHLAWSPDAHAIALSPRDDGIIRLYAARDGQPIVRVCVELKCRASDLCAQADVPVVGREETQQEIVFVRWYSGLRVLFLWAIAYVN